MRAAVVLQYQQIAEIIAASLQVLCGEKMPKNFEIFCPTMQRKVMFITERYIHNYNDYEICTDIGYCENTMVGIPKTPLGKI